ncbi:glycosyltransferase family 2 protein [Flavobacterium reichenbachii]|uniref:Glycosyltransferase 2-like domain-containing protein n=1 Tax=Flavobacterium reichenbachii TaxID=362418 RepID=A0A085ZP05_9FLAO|nr:glycosyltransferase family A protein [Flavobacterium reichenbachii]KFF06169.1 hypothetical protein IW19_11780 [Flavobacterium reichenbachii]OXB17610.1 hypothetical protein B0A68_04790 [Flavobacterium reichenbachii]
MANVFSENDLEILIATKDRSNLDFLTKMFPSEHFSNFNLLIINQSEILVLHSEYPTVRVINAAEIGLSKSRNKAVKNAVKKICLITDDDVVFIPNFQKDIVEAFSELTEASVITFNHIRFGNSQPEKKEIQSYKHSLKSIWKVSSIEIAFKLEEIKKHQIYFDEWFGLGSFFETAEEFLFLKTALKHRLKMYYSPKIIVSHPEISSGRNEGSHQLIFARSALFYKIKGKYAYLWLLKYLLFLYRNDHISKSGFKEKYKIGLSGIYKYQELAQKNL